MQKTLSSFLGLSLLASSFAFAFAVPAFATPNTSDDYNWDTSGDYVINMEHLGNDNYHDMTLYQDEYGNLSGHGGSPAGDNTYRWTINDGMVNDDSIEFTADYTSTEDAVNPQTTMVVEGTIADDGTMSGTWSDNYDGNHRAGNWTTESGDAEDMTTLTSETADQNNDGFVDGAEGVPFYGDIEVSLTETGDTSPASALALDRFPVANQYGDYYYERTITVSNEIRDSIINSSIVVHGLDIDDSEAYDGEKESSIADGVPFEATVPVACGTIEGAYGQYTADINQLNSTGVDGYATLSLNGNELTVGMNVSDTSANLAHAQHIHIGGTNECPPNTAGAAMNDSDAVTVTIDKFVQGIMATAASADFADFPMTSIWDDENGADSGSYTLGDTNSTPYRAMTSEMEKGSDYQTSETLTTGIVGAECSDGKPFALEGYTSGNTKAAAMNETPSMVAPSFTNLQQDKFVIVWNRDCDFPNGGVNGDNDGQLSGEVESSVELEVTLIEMVDTSATANGSFNDGWEYVFHITAPMNEENIAMKFSNWLQNNGNDTINVANNMRISSQQANNNGATILLTGANIYSTPVLTMVEDIDLSEDGRQVEITVEVAVPFGTSSGTYTTSYGVQSN